MTILHVTDFHFNKRWFNWLPDHAPSHDFLVLSGDLLNRTDTLPRRQQIDWVADWIADYPQPMSVCSGPHDLEWDRALERWTPAYWLRELNDAQVWTDSQRFEVDGLSLLSIDCTTRPKGGKADLWVVHTPPAGTFVSTHTDGRDGGDSELAGSIRRHTPSMVFSGGVHDPVSWCADLDGTVCLNPGLLPDAPYPNHILVNTEDLSCRFVTVGTGTARPSFEAVTLQVPLGTPAAAVEVI